MFCLIENREGLNDDEDLYERKEEELSIAQNLKESLIHLALARSPMMLCVKKLGT